MQLQLAGSDAVGGVADDQVQDRASPDSRCTIEPSCFNPCEPESCELCFPDGIEALAPGCEAPACPAGVSPCLDPYDCPEDERCSGGCCLPRDVL